VQPVVKPCFVRIHKEQKTSLKYLAKQIEALQKVEEHVSAAKDKDDSIPSKELQALVFVTSDTAEIRSSVIEAFVVLVEAKQTINAPRPGYAQNGFGNVWRDCNV
jgi:hypothetical protein